MEYLPRDIEREVQEGMEQFKVLLVTGPRQVGKTTMLRHMLGDSYQYVSLDDPDMLARIRDDSKLFFLEHRPPIVLDEIQHAPELFLRIKNVVDASESYGQIVLTGSQTFHLMKGVSESLAGRVGILEMQGISLRERLGFRGGSPFVPSSGQGKRPETPVDTWRIIHRGSMPRLLDESAEWSRFYASYVQTYIERDVRAFVNVRDASRFYDFMVACAARTGQLFNASDIASTIGADPKTVRGWVSALEASGIVKLLRPFFTNTEKRLAKAPKLFFMDTGLACYLTAWPDAETLRRGAAAGHMFETFVVSEVVKSYLNCGGDTRDISFYRDASKREIDLVIRRGRTLHPVEIKSAASVSASACRHFAILDGIEGYERGFGAVICQTDNPYLIAEDVRAIPVWMI